MKNSWHIGGHDFFNSDIDIHPSECQPTREECQQKTGVNAEGDESTVKSGVECYTQLKDELKKPDKRKEGKLAGKK
ncbi:hypothetical protein CI610_01140 [invertebrate metagenome]|uniref:Uncharacterized protein n=1 Tax=invertebrate metagenome TaxID=1711999 RepID=A0A2H9T9D0_9ZZZZ